MPWTKVPELPPIIGTIKVIHRNLKVILWVSCVPPSTYLKRVIVTPVVYPRLVEFLHFDIQSAGPEITAWTTSLSCLQTSWPNKCLWASTTYCIKTVLLGTGLAGHRVNCWRQVERCWAMMFVIQECWFKSFVTSPQETFCDKENWNILLIQVIYAHLLRHLKQRFA